MLTTVLIITLYISDEGPAASGALLEAPEASGTTTKVCVVMCVCGLEVLMEGLVSMRP